jgi:hypothetical protein
VSTGNAFCNVSRPGFNLLSRRGWRNLWSFGFKPWNRRYYLDDTWVAVKCRVLGHKLAWTTTCGPTRYYCPRCFHEFLR